MRGTRRTRVAASTNRRTRSSRKSAVTALLGGTTWVGARRLGDAGGRGRAEGRASVRWLFLSPPLYIPKGPWPPGPHLHGQRRIVCLNGNARLARGHAHELGPLAAAQVLAWRLRRGGADGVRAALGVVVVAGHLSGGRRGGGAGVGPGRPAAAFAARRAAHAACPHPARAAPAPGAAAGRWRCPASPRRRRRGRAVARRPRAPPARAARAAHHPCHRRTWAASDPATSVVQNRAASAALPMAAGVRWRGGLRDTARRRAQRGQGERERVWMGF
jgi:hypothetical protein